MKCIIPEQIKIWSRGEYKNKRGENMKYCLAGTMIYSFLDSSVVVNVCNMNGHTAWACKDQGPVYIGEMPSNSMN